MKAVVLALCLLATPALAVDIPIHVHQAVTFSLATASFGTGSVGVPSAPLPITVSNIGTVAVPFTAGISGTNAADFAISSNNCAGSVAAGSTCQISIVLTPSITGEETASLDLTATSGRVYSVALHGGAGTLTVTLTPSTASVSSTQPVGAILSKITTSWSDGHIFTGSFSITTDPAGLCRISGTNVVLARAVTSTDVGSFICTVTGTE